MTQSSDVMLWCAIVPAWRHQGIDYCVQSKLGVLGEVGNWGGGLSAWVGALFEKDCGRMGVGKLHVDFVV